MTNPKNHRIDSASRVIAASPKAIYDAFMNPEVLIFWLPPKGTKVTIICENVPPGIKKEDHDIGLNFTLENLASFIEIDH